MAGSMLKIGDGKYRLFVSDGTGKGGKRKRHSKIINVSNDRAAEKELARFIIEVERGNVTDLGKTTFGDYTKKFKEIYLKDKADNTIYNYELMLDNRILPHIKHMKMKDIKTIHVLEFMKDLTKRKTATKTTDELSENTRSHYYKLLLLMFNVAVKWGYVTDNPVSNVDAPKPGGHKADYYNADECKLLFSVIDDFKLDKLKYKAGIYIVVTGGLRLGEINALKWTDFDEVNNMIKIDKSVQRVPKKKKVKETKNVSSVRWLTIPQITVEALNEYRAYYEWVKTQMGDKWLNNDYMFTNDNGGLIGADTLSKGFAKVIKDHNLRKITFHELRHTMSTLLINDGMNIRELSRRLGHSRTSTTLDIYSHTIQSADKVAANKIDNMFEYKKAK